MNNAIVGEEADGQRGICGGDGAKVGGYLVVR
jgi:hypothetical protein